jgi:hypothetical protein
MRFLVALADCGERCLPFFPWHCHDVHRHALTLAMVASNASRCAGVISGNSGVLSSFWFDTATLL